MNNQITYTKLDQWNAFTKVLREDILELQKLAQKTNILLDGDSKLVVYKEMFLHLLENEEKDNLFPTQLVIVAHGLYQALIEYNVSIEQFLDHIKLHIENYVISQYGDFPDRYIESVTDQKILGKIEAYVDRIGRIQATRGEDAAIQDCLKIAHFANYFYWLVEKGNAQAM